MIGAWDAYVQAPATVLQRPVAIERRRGDVVGARALVTGDGVARLSYKKGGRAPVVVLDFGKEVGGYPLFTVRDFRRETALRSSYSETLTGLNADGDYAGRARLTRVQVQPVTRRGRFLSRQIEGGQRYVRLTLTKPGRVDLSLAGLVFSGFRGTPDRLRGMFLSSDRRLNEIWYAGVYTVNLNQVAGDPPVLIDGGKRDRKIWSGDLLTAAPTVYYALDPRYVRGSLQTLAGSGQIPLPGKCLPDGSDCRYYSAAYSMAFVLALREYLRYAGDRAFVRALLPTVLRQLDDDGRHVNRDGLYVVGPTGGRTWNLESFPGELTYVNSVYAAALVSGAELAETFGFDGGPLRARAAAVRDAVNAQLWNEPLGAYNVSTTLRGPIAQDANLMAVLSGVAPPERAARVLPALETALATPFGPRNVSEPVPEGFREIVSPYMAGFQLMAQFAAGRDRQALDLMRTEWGWMLDHDPGATTWEKIRVDGKLRHHASGAHAWSTGATAALSRYVLGAAPVRPAWRTWTVAPHPGDVAWAEGRVPTRRGTLAVSWKRSAAGFRLRVAAPAGTAGTVSVPLLGRDRTVRRDGVPLAGTRLGDYAVFARQSGTHTYTW